MKILKIHDIFLTPPIIANSYARVCIVTLLQHSDVEMYLCAIKTFYNSLIAVYPHRPCIRILDDGTLTDSDKLHIALNVVNVVIERPTGRNITEYFLTRGGCWDRLSYMDKISSYCYVINLDADTLTFGAIKEIAEAIETNVSFSLCQSDDSKVYALEKTHEIKRAQNYIFATGCFEKWPKPTSVFERYIKGNAGLCGIARRFKDIELDRAKLAYNLIEGTIGARITEWGTEQIGCNLILAYDPDVVMLPTDYKVYRATDTGSVRFLHFVGQFRDADNFYDRTRRQIVAEMPKVSRYTYLKLITSWLKGYATQVKIKEKERGQKLYDQAERLFRLAKRREANASPSVPIEQIHSEQKDRSEVA